LLSLANLHPSDDTDEFSNLLGTKRVQETGEMKYC
jgi:hypothetical protein